GCKPSEQTHHRRCVPCSATRRKDRSPIKLVRHPTHASDPCGLHIRNDGVKVLCAPLSMRLNDRQSLRVAHLLALESTSTVGVAWPLHVWVPALARRRDPLSGDLQSRLGALADKARF